MSSMLTTVWLILGALSFAAIMEEAGFLNRLIAPLVREPARTPALITSVAGTSVGLNVVAGDQYVADVLPSRVFRTSSPAGASPRGCCRAPSRTPAPSPRRSCRGTAAAPT